MSMFDIIKNVPVDCPICGNSDLKSVEIKVGSQDLIVYEFRQDKIPINWNYPYYGGVIDCDKHIIRGMATCECDHNFEVAIWIKDDVPVDVDRVEKLD